MKLKHIICNLGLLAMLPVVSSCGDFFDEVPSRGDNEVLNRGEQVRNLFANILINLQLVVQNAEKISF